MSSNIINQGGMTQIVTTWYAAGALTTPTGYSLQIYDPTGTPYGSPVTSGAANLNPGILQYTVGIPTNALLGTWSWVWQATVSGSSQIIDGTFIVAAVPPVTRTPNFYVSAAQVREIIDTNLTDAQIVDVASTMEGVVASNAHIPAALLPFPQSGTVALPGLATIQMPWLILQEILVREAAVEIKTRDPTAQGAGQYKETHFPQQIWLGELNGPKGLYAIFLRMPAFAQTAYQTGNIAGTWGQ
jgi:hypothetical protein